MINRETFFAWMDGLLSRKLPPETAALCLNLYEDGEDTWSAELIGSDRFDPEDSDWACYEVFAFRDKPFRFRQTGGWEAAQAEAVSAWKDYLNHGRDAAAIKACRAAAAGFVDGDLETVYVSAE